MCGGYRGVECAGVTGVFRLRWLQECLQGIEMCRSYRGVGYRGVQCAGTTLLQLGAGCGGYTEVQCVHGVREGCRVPGLHRGVGAREG